MPVAVLSCDWLLDTGPVHSPDSEPPFSARGPACWYRGRGNRPQPHFAPAYSASCCAPGQQMAYYGEGSNSLMASSSLSVILLCAFHYAKLQHQPSLQTYTCSQRVFENVAMVMVRTLVSWNPLSSFLPSNNGIKMISYLLSTHCLQFIFVFALVQIYSRHTCLLLIFTFQCKALLVAFYLCIYLTFIWTEKCMGTGSQWCHGYMH